MNDCARTSRTIEATAAESELLVCVKCRQSGGAGAADGAADGAAADGGLRPGRRLYEALNEALNEAMAGADAPAGVRLRAVDCLQNCDAGCTAALRGGAGRWTYVYGNLGPALAETLLDGARAYHAAPDGLIPWRQRPEHFKRNCVARIPPAEFPDPLQET